MVSLSLFLGYKCSTLVSPAAADKLRANVPTEQPHSQQYIYKIKPDMIIKHEQIQILHNIGEGVLFVLSLTNFFGYNFLINLLLCRRIWNCL